MLVNADIYVKDVPGQLVSALEPMTTLNANIIGVVHSREQMVSGRIAVNITFDVDPDLIGKLKDIWISRDVIVANIGSVVKLHYLRFMAIGGVTADAMQSMLDDAKAVTEIESADIRVSTKSAGGNTAMVTVGLRTPEALDALDGFVSGRCREAGYTYIKGVEQ